MSKQGLNSKNFIRQLMSDMTLVDTNIVIDLLSKRKKFYEEA
jgi:hypothetical protein